MDNGVTAYFWSYAHNEFTQEQLKKWDLIIGEPVYVVPVLGLFTRRPDQVDGGTHVKIESTTESDKAGKLLLDPAYLEYKQSHEE